MDERSLKILASEKKTNKQSNKKTTTKHTHTHTQKNNNNNYNNNSTHTQQQQQQQQQLQQNPTTMSVHNDLNVPMHYQALFIV